MSVKLTGTVTKILPAFEGIGQSGKSWIKQSFILTEEGQYPTDICIDGWNDKADIVKDLVVGTQITAHVNIKSRESGDRWFTSAGLWKIEAAQQPSQPAPTQVTTPAPAPTMPAPTGDDGLPF